MGALFCLPAVTAEGSESWPLSDLAVEAGEAGSIVPFSALAAKSIRHCELQSLLMFMAIHSRAARLCLLDLAKPLFMLLSVLTK